MAPKSKKKKAKQKPSKPIATIGVKSSAAVAGRGGAKSKFKIKSTLRCSMCQRSPGSASDCTFNVMQKMLAKRGKAAACDACLSGKGPKRPPSSSVASAAPIAAVINDPSKKMAAKDSDMPQPRQEDASSAVAIPPDTRTKKRKLSDDHEQSPQSPQAPPVVTKKKRPSAQSKPVSMPAIQQERKDDDDDDDRGSSSDIDGGGDSSSSSSSSSSGSDSDSDSSSTTTSSSSSSSRNGSDSDSKSDDKHDTKADAEHAHPTSKENPTPPNNSKSCTSNDGDSDEIAVIKQGTSSDTKPPPSCAGNDVDSGNAKSTQSRPEGGMDATQVAGTKVGLAKAIPRKKAIGGKKDDDVKATTAPAPQSSTKAMASAGKDSTKGDVKSKPAAPDEHKTRLQFSDGESIEVGDDESSSSSSSRADTHNSDHHQNYDDGDGLHGQVDHGDVSMQSADPGSDVDVSLKDLKRKILGRELVTDFGTEDYYDDDEDGMDARENMDEIQQRVDYIKQRLLGQSNSTNTNSNASMRIPRKSASPSVGTTPRSAKPPPTTTTILSTDQVGASLRKDLSCAICHDPYYQPVSLPCGHSFCKECLNWWLGRLNNDNAASATAATVRGTCPTCRQTLACPQSSLSVNLSLRACVVTLFGKDIVNRIKSAQRATSGERNGAHSRGHEVISGLDDEPWRTIAVNCNNDSANRMLKLRRSIVLDARDQRMQLALCLAETPTYDADKGYIFNLSLIMMEEDEAEDGGFPTMISNVEDEHLICLAEERFQTYIEVNMKTPSGGDTAAPLARLAISNSTKTAIPFELDFNDANRDVSYLHFCHAGTHAELEIDLSQIHASQHNASTAVRKKRNKSRNMYVMDDEATGSEEEHDYDPEEERKDRAFFVDDDHDSGMEGNFSGNEEEVVGSDYYNETDGEDSNDACHICNEAGELLICDGGDEIQGCERSFHIHCIGRDTIPNGDWVCQSCAKKSGLDDVGKEGHEIVMEEPSLPTKPARSSKPKLESKVFADSSDEEFETKSSAKDDQAETAIDVDKEPSPLTEPKTKEGTKTEPMVLADGSDEETNTKPTTAIGDSKKETTESAIDIDDDDDGSENEDEDDGSDDDDDDDDDDDSPIKMKPASGSGDGNKKKRMVLGDDSDDD